MSESNERHPAEVRVVYTIPLPEAGIGDDVHAILYEDNMMSIVTDGKAIVHRESNIEDRLLIERIAQLGGAGHEGKAKVKRHYFNLSFSGEIQEKKGGNNQPSIGDMEYMWQMKGSSSGSAVIGCAKKVVTGAEVKLARESLNYKNNAVLLSVSYLGYMTREEAKDV